MLSETGVPSYMPCPCLHLVRVQLLLEPTLASILCRYSLLIYIWIRELLSTLISLSAAIFPLWKLKLGGGNDFWKHFIIFCFTGFSRFENEALVKKFSHPVHSHCSKLNGLHHRWIFRSCKADYHCFRKSSPTPKNKKKKSKLSLQEWTLTVSLLCESRWSYPSSYHLHWFLSSDSQVVKLRWALTEAP